MKDNVILTDMDESIGFYKDLYAMFVDVIKGALDSGDVNVAKEQIEYLEEMEEYKDFPDLLVLSMNNGVGFTCRPYQPEVVHGE